jgi:ribosomal-protein-alanine N-acetyltransferase
MDTAAELADRRTARLVLRRPEAGDVEWVAALHADPLNYTHAPDCAHRPRQARSLAEGQLRAWDRDGISYWVVEHDGERVGMAGITYAAFYGRACWNLYYRFVPAARGHGFAGEATREALAVAALIDPARPVIVRTRPTNEPARRVAEAIGLVRRLDLDADGFTVYVSDTWGDG